MIKTNLTPSIAFIIPSVKISIHCDSDSSMLNLEECVQNNMLDLTGKNALVTGIANNRSIAWGIAQQLHQGGANLGITYLPDDKGKFAKKDTLRANPAIISMESLIAKYVIQNLNN